MYKRGILNNPAVLNAGLNFQPLERNCGSNKNYELLLICLALAQLSVNLREQSSTDATGPKFMGVIHCRRGYGAGGPADSFNSSPTFSARCKCGPIRDEQRRDD